MGNISSKLQALIKNWSNKSSEEKRRAILLKLKSVSLIPFIFGRATFLKIYFNYLPDAYTHFNAYPEFKSIFKKFIKFNKLNNAGDIVRLWSFILNIKQILHENIEGDFAELGVWRGNTAAVLAHYAALDNRKVYLFDTYEGFSNKDLSGIDADKQMEFNDTSISMVKGVIGEASACCDFVKGYFPDSLTDLHKTIRYSVVSLDCDLYEPMKEGLNFFYPLMSQGAIFLLHDYSSLYWEGAKKAIDDFCIQNNEYVILMPDKSGSAFIRKSKR